MDDLDIFDRYDLLEELMEQRNRQLAEARAECETLREALISLVAVARRYLPDYDEHPEIQKADAALTANAALTRRP